MVYVIAKNGKPLMPCANPVARLLLKQGKAKVKRREPFAIRLNYETTAYTQDLTLGVDTGSKTLGAAVTNDKNEIVYLSEVTLRDDVKDKLERRKVYRRNRRARKTRYRKPRFLNRRHSIQKGRLIPTIRSKIHSHEKEIELIRSILPVTTIVLETGQFDPHLMKNPELADPKIRPWGYQRGPQYGYENLRAMILDRDGYLCRYCKGKHKDSKLDVHHIVYRTNGGSNDPSNLITLCHTCHKKLHDGKIRADFSGQTEGTLKYATQMNSVRRQVLLRYPEAIETFGYVTKANRMSMGIEKSHWADACMIATGGEPFRVPCRLYRKRCVPEGDYQQTKGISSRQPITTGKICGFRKFDKVRFRGREYFMKGRMSSGYAILMDIDGHKADFSDLPKGCRTPKLKELTRLKARTSWMVTSETVIQNTA